jgi:hypothetical protein
MPLRANVTSGPVPGGPAGARGCRWTHAGLDVSFGDHPHVEAGPVVGDQQRGHIPVADAHLVVGQAADHEVLPERAVAEVVAAEVPPPVPTGTELVDQHGPLLAAVPPGVTLAIAGRPTFTESSTGVRVMVIVAAPFAEGVPNSDRMLYWL